VIFQRPLRVVWDAALAVQERYNVDLLPALTIFAGVFLFHEARKRQQMKADARAALAESAQARVRSAELERLMALSHALANALDPTTLQQALRRHLPGFTYEREFWVLTRAADRWEIFLQETIGIRTRPLEELERMADRVVSREFPANVPVDGVLVGEIRCFPMLAGGVVVGVFGIYDSGMVRDQQQALGAATGLLAIAVRNVQLLLETRELNVRDGLTSCFTRSHGLERLEGELRRTRRSRQPLSILMFDIDHFKAINDQLGHQRGDDLLRAVGVKLTRVLRSTDMRCRYGGDEFLIILPDTPLLGAQHVADSVRNEIATLAMAAGDQTLPVTVSIGVATAAREEPGIAVLLERADEALYQAKRSGRNQCRLAGAPEPPPGAVAFNAIGVPSSGFGQG
jgi:diguanylate cyclase (GGDEF)-like protein